MRKAATSAWLSVLMPTYNGARYLGRALDSIAAHGDKHVEVILIDNVSTDATLSIAESFSHRLNISIVTAPNGGNWLVSLNRALRLATGEFVCMLHDDDLWLEGRGSVARRTLEANPSVDGLFSPSWFIDRGGRRVGELRCPLPALPERLPRAEIVRRLSVQNFLAAPAPIVRRSLALSVGGWDETLWYMADWDLWLKVASVGEVGYVKTALTAYRVHSRAQTLARRREWHDISRQYSAVLQRHSRSGGFSREDDAAARAARLSARLNVFLIGRQIGSGVQCVKAALAASPQVWRRFVRDSRIAERLMARLRGVS